MKWTVASLLLLVAAVPCGAQVPQKLTPSQVDTVLDGVVNSLKDYVFPDTAAQMQASIRGQRSQYREISDPEALATRLTADLRTVGHDHHLQVVFKEELGIQQAPTEEERQHAHFFDRVNGYGIRSARRLPGNIGYVDLAYFSPDEDAGEAISNAMGLISGTDLLILDLRRNGGGSGETATALLSYFFAEPVQLSSILERQKGQVLERQKWTMPYVSGPRYAEKPIYVLIGPHTHSAAELCAYDLQARHRATILGARSSGDANSSKGVLALGMGFSIFVPNGETRNPITHSNWEGKGVQPDVATAPETALLTAYEKALKEARPGVTDSEAFAKERALALRNPQAALNEEAEGFADLEAAH